MKWKITPIKNEVDAFKAVYGDTDFTKLDKPESNLKLIFIIVLYSILSGMLGGSVAWFYFNVIIT